MSRELIETFVQQVNMDTALQERIKNVAKGNVDELIKIANAAGFQFTRDEWQTALQPISDELSDADLNEVAAGCFPPIGTSNIHPVLISFLAH